MKYKLNNIYNEDCLEGMKIDKNQKDITLVFALLAVSVVLAILTIFSFVMMQKAINEKIEIEKAYYQIQAEAMFYEEISEVFEYLLEEEKSINAELKEDYIECLVRYFNEQEEMEFMIYLYNNYPEIFYDILSFYY